MKILVAGGAGYIGSTLVPILQTRGHEVTVLDLLWFGNHLPAEVPVLEKDISDLMPGDLEGYDRVVFMAGLSNDPMADFAPGQNFTSNTAAPAYLAWLAHKAGVRRMVYAGSCAVYGLTEGGVMDETKEPACETPYGISKYLGERAAHYFQDPNFSVITLRMGTVSGYSPRMRLDLVVNTMFKAAVDTGHLVVNNPSIWRPILPVQDAAAGFVAAVEAPDEVSGIFNVAAGNHSIGEIGEVVQRKVKAAFGRPVDMEILAVPECRSYRVSTTSAAEVLGFHPTLALEDILDDLVANHHRFQDFDNPRYYNIRFLENLSLPKIHPGTAAGARGQS
jgi:nucleoside-diphosphate-sugar epimerase